MKKEKKREFYCRVFHGDCGGVVLADLKEFCKYDEASFVTDTHLAAYLQGRRSVICEIIKWMEGRDEQ